MPLASNWNYDSALAPSHHKLKYYATAAAAAAALPPPHQSEPHWPKLFPQYHHKSAPKPNYNYRINLPDLYNYDYQHDKLIQNSPYPNEETNESGEIDASGSADDSVEMESDQRTPYDIIGLHDTINQNNANWMFAGGQHLVQPSSTQHSSWQPLMQFPNWEANGFQHGRGGATSYRDNLQHFYGHSGGGGSNQLTTNYDLLDAETSAGGPSSTAIISYDEHMSPNNKHNKKNKWSKKKQKFNRNRFLNSRMRFQ